VPTADQSEFYTVVCCHSFSRCEEISDFAKELVQFCPEMLDVINLDTAEMDDCLARLKSAKGKSRLVVSTPSVIQRLLN
jgi:ATP-dependent RNA helicase DDX56/DBP9